LDGTSVGCLYIGLHKPNRSAIRSDLTAICNTRAIVI